MRPGLRRRVFEGISALALLGVSALGMLWVFLWLEFQTEVILPTPTGPFRVGRTIADWADETATDPMAPVPGTKRELLVWIWYPADAGAPDAVVDDYLPASVQAPVGRGGGIGIFRLLTRDPSKVHGHSLRDPEVSRRQPMYPVVIMRAGASAPVMNYSTLAEDLASHGYIVVGFDAPYRTSVVIFPDRRVITRRPENNPELFSGEALAGLASRLLAAWTGDTAFALDRLAQLNTSQVGGAFRGRLDMTRVGIFGHSFGGATAAAFCSQDPRCQAGIDVDGSLHGRVIQAGIQKPFMFLLSDHGDVSSSAEARQILADIESVYDRLPVNGRLFAVIRGANHFTFSDDGALRKSRLVRGALRLFGKLGIDGRRQLVVTAYCIRTLFDATLKAPHPARPRLSSPQYPEIQVLR